MCKADWNFKNEQNFKFSIFFLFIFHCSFIHHAPKYRWSKIPFILPPSWITLEYFYLQSYVQTYKLFPVQWVQITNRGHQQLVTAKNDDNRDGFTHIEASINFRQTVVIIWGEIIERDGVKIIQFFFQNHSGKSIQVTDDTPSQKTQTTTPRHRKKLNQQFTT